jgi:hypothetical protein
MSRAHSHVCTRCQQSFGCAGELIHNYDGFPEVVCVLFHVDGERTPAFTQCEDCVMTTWCAHCGSKPALTEHDGDQVCTACADAASRQTA